MIIRRSLALLLSIVILVTTAPRTTGAHTEHRYIVRTVASVLDGTTIIQSVCRLLGCNMRYALDGGANRLFLVTTNTVTDATGFLLLLLAQPSIAHAEIDQVLTTLAASQGEVVGPPALYDRVPVDFYTAQVWRGYLTQPAAERVRLTAARSCSGLTGLNVTVAVIDTGVDPQHPVLAPVLAAGYDFTRDLAGGSELRDLNTDQSTMAVVDDAAPALVNQSTMAVVDQSTMAVVDDPSLAAFGHGTMVAGLVHLVAPQARILPLKAFGSDGTGYLSDVLRSIYYATHNGAKVLNLSFSFRAPSVELSRALQYASSRGALAVASAGNTGQYAPSYPGSLPGVIGVASTTDWDVLSTFSNYGEDLFWIAAPGEAVVTTYPFATYAAAWGTSFSAPLGAGTAALLAQATPWIDQSRTRTAVGQAVPVAGVARGRLDVPRALATEAVADVCGTQ